MAGASLLTLIDDIATLLDDVAVLTKTASTKTAGVLGDDLALNAEQVSGVNPDRELPVVWAVGKGSMVNKAILVPVALAISAVAPWAIIPLLMIGGAFLCYEGFHKVAEVLFHHTPEAKEVKVERRSARMQAVADPQVDLVALEKAKIKGAIRTDFILSAEIIVIALGTVAQAPLAKKAMVLVVVAVLLTVAVYGVVAGIVKMDDAGLALSKRKSRAQQALGRLLLRGAPLLMKSLSVVGTVAMFMVGGGIIAHGIAPLHHLIEKLGASAGAVPGIGFLTGFLTSALLNTLVGVISGGLVSGLVALVTGVVNRLRRKPAP